MMLSQSRKELDQMAMTRKDFVVVAEALTYNPCVYNGSEEGKQLVRDLMAHMKKVNPRFCEQKFTDYLFFNRKVA